MLLCVFVGACQPIVHIVCLVALLYKLELSTQDGETDLCARKQQPSASPPGGDNNEPLHKEEVLRLFVAFLQLLCLF